MFGLGRQKPHHYREMLKIVWENRDELPFAWRILNDGVCDGCALGTSGLSDWTLDGPAPVHGAARADAAEHRAGARSRGGSPTSRRCRRARSAGSCASSDACPSRCCAAAASAAFASPSWDEALERIAAELRARRSGARRVLPDLARHHQRGLLRRAEGGAVSRHQPRRQLGAAVPRGVDRGDEGHARLRRVDLQLRRLAARRSDRALRIERRQQPAGDDEVPASREAERRADRRRQPVPRAGARALLGAVDRVERAVRHGARRPLVRRAHRRRPRVPRSACFARWSRSAASTRRSCASARTASRRRAIAALAATGRRSSATAARRATACEAFARLLVERPNAVFVWSMGLTQHAHGVETIKALMNVGLARGLPGRPNRGLVPIRGHSGVQGGAEVGCVPKLDAATAARWAEVWGFPCPAGAGLDDGRDDRARGGRRRRSVLDRRRQFSRDAARRRAHRARALQRPRLRIHQDIVLSSSMLVESDGDVLLLPAATRYESRRRRHRDLDRAADHLLAGDSRPPDRIGAAGVAGVRRRDGARVSRTRAH